MTNNLNFQIVRWNQETFVIYKSTITIWTIIIQDFESYFETTQYLMRNVKLCCKIYPMYIYDLINPVIINNFTYFLHLKYSMFVILFIETIQRNKSSMAAIFELE